MKQTEAAIQEVLCKKRPQKFCRTNRNKRPRQSLPFNKAAGQRPATLSKNYLAKPPENTHFHRASLVAASEQIKNGKHFS